VWLRTNEQGEDIESVLIRSTGVPTYFGVDVAYHREALVERGFDKKLDVWGANTHGHARRMKNAMAALGLEDRWEGLLYQFVRFLHEGLLVNMAQRRDQFIGSRRHRHRRRMLRALVLPHSERGSDARLHLEPRSSSRRQPHHYVQYAHARIASIFRTAAEQGVTGDGADVGALPTRPNLAWCTDAPLPGLVERSPTKANVHLLTSRPGLASAFHAFYKNNRVVGDRRRSRSPSPRTSRPLAHLRFGTSGFSGHPPPSRCDPSASGVGLGLPLAPAPAAGNWVPPGCHQDVHRADDDGLRRDRAAPGVGCPRR
jgi:arginyl-tRNA synthetase